VKLVVNKKASTASSTAATCFASFQPSAMTCETLKDLPSVKNENIATPGSFVNGTVVPLSVRFTPPLNADGSSNAPVYSALTPDCKFGPPANVGTKCDLMVMVDSSTTLTMNGIADRAWVTKKLTSTADADAKACTNRFLGGATLPASAPAIGTVPADVNKNSFCLGLSSQLNYTGPIAAPASSPVTSAVMTGPRGYSATVEIVDAPIGAPNALIANTVVNPTVTQTGTAVRGLNGKTVQLSAVFTAANGSKSAPVYVGTCKYNSDGSPALSPITIQGTSAPTLTTSIGGTFTKSFPSSTPIPSPAPSATPCAYPGTPIQLPSPMPIPSPTQSTVTTQSSACVTPVLQINSVKTTYDGPNGNDGAFSVEILNTAAAGTSCVQQTTLSISNSLGSWGYPVTVPSGGKIEPAGFIMVPNITAVDCTKVKGAQTANMTMTIGNSPAGYSYKASITVKCPGTATPSPTIAPLRTAPTLIEATPMIDTGFDR